MKKIALLGCTGSIGLSSLKIIESNPGKYKVIALAAGRNLELLIQQIHKFRPLAVAVSEDNLAGTLRERIRNISGVKVYSGKRGSIHLATLEEVDIVISAITGAAGLAPTYAAIKAGKVIALANKETMVMAGALIMEEAKKTGTSILPIDSEHSAIWQCLNNETQKATQLILTASGGPFLHYSPAQLKMVTAKQALKHPSWSMGRKVTIDSATLMNKGLEIIEAHWLFNIPFNNIGVLIHPQSIVHSMVEFIDGSIKAQLSYPDMRLPIQYALSYPERWTNPQLPRLDWNQINNLTFEQPDLAAFPCLRLAIEAGKKGGTYPAVLCATDEVAVELFLSGHIKFVDITNLVEETLSQHQVVNQPRLEEIIAADTWAREKVEQLARRDNPC